MIVYLLWWSTIIPKLTWELYWNLHCVSNTFFPFKDRVPLMLRSLVVYKYTCASCNASYIGKTKHHLHTRVSQHLGISPRTNNPVASPVFSAIRTHSEETGHPIIRDNFKVLSNGRSDRDVSIRESLLILRDNPLLNRHIPVSKIYLFFE